VGHEKGTIGYGHYSGWAYLANKKEAIEKVRYPFYTASKMSIYNHQCTVTR